MHHTSQANSWWNSKYPDNNSGLFINFFLESDSRFRDILCIISLAEISTISSLTISDISLRPRNSWIPYLLWCTLHKLKGSSNMRLWFSARRCQAIILRIGALNPAWVPLTFWQLSCIPWLWAWLSGCGWQPTTWWIVVKCKQIPMQPAGQYDQCGVESLALWYW